MSHGRAILTLVFAGALCIAPARGVSRPKVTGAPTMKLSYAFVDPSLEGVGRSFAPLGGVELCLGSMTIEPERGGILRYESGDFQIGKVAASLRDPAESGKIDPEGWRLNLNWSRGYGYPLRSARLLLYHTIGLGFTRLDMDTTGLEAGDLHHLGYFDETFCFGSNTAAGALLQIGPVFGIEGSFERSLAFRKVLFGKWAGSELIEQAGHALIELFVDKVRQRRPLAAPIVSFLLQNGLAYAAYELRRDDMNYPFESPPPLLLDNFKVGLRVTF